MMLKSLFGGKKRRGKSVNHVRGQKPRKKEQGLGGNAGGLDARIKARRAKNLKMADVKAALESAGYIPKPDIGGAVDLAKAIPDEAGKKEHGAAIDRALRLKGSARIIDETLAHPTWRYVALAIVRGLLEDAGDTRLEADRGASGPPKGSSKRH